MLMENVNLFKSKILIAGSSGFTGFNLVKVLIELKIPMTIVGIDNKNDYYDVSLK